jgi:hypothetical protein
MAELMGGEVTADQMVMFTVNGGSAVIFVSSAPTVDPHCRSCGKSKTDV